MNSADLVSMLGNLSRSLPSVQALITGFAYVLGILLMVSGIMKLRNLTYGSREKKMVPFAYLLGASALLFLPSMVDILSNSAFGVGNILQYTRYQPYSIYNSMGIVIQTAGLIWFVRGCVLLIHSSDASQKNMGSKGLLFLIAGIFAINFKDTYSTIGYIINKLISFTSY